MSEIIKIQPKLSAFFRADDVAKFFDITRPAIRGQTHHLALVAIMREAEKLRRRSVQNACGVGILHLVQDLYRISISDCPHRRDEVAETVNREQRGAIER